MKNNKQILAFILSIALVFLLAVGSISFADGDTGFNSGGVISNSTDVGGDISNSTDAGGNNNGQTEPVNYGNSTVAIGNFTDGGNTNSTDVVGNSTEVGEIPGSAEQNTFDVSGIKDKTYNGKAQTQNLVVKSSSDGTKLTKGVDYSVKYSNNKNVGTASLTVTGMGAYADVKSVTKTFKIKKAANTIKVTRKTAKIKYNNLKKKNQKLAASKVMTIKGRQGTLSCRIVKVSKAKYKKYFKMDKSGNLTVKKKLKKGTYKITAKVTAAGNKNYKSATKQVTFTVKVVK